MKRQFKPISYGLMHLIVAVSVAYLLTGNLSIALGIGLVEPLVQTVFYTFHERAWDKWAGGGNSLSSPMLELAPAHS